MVASTATCAVVRKPPPGVSGPKTKGNIAKKPYCGAVFTRRTKKPAMVRLSRQRMSMPSVSRRRLVGLAVEASAMGRRPCGSVTAKQPIAAPRATRTSDRTSVPYSLIPRGPTASAANPAPSVGRPPVNANQNQPAAEPRIRGFEMVWIQTRKEKANNG